MRCIIIEAFFMLIDEFFKNYCILFSYHFDLNCLLDGPGYNSINEQRTVVPRDNQTFMKYLVLEGPFGYDTFLIKHQCLPFVKKTFDVLVL
jgi:hypothetical protein